MAIIVGDIHGDVGKARAFLEYKPEEEHVALGDYVDSFHEPQTRQIEALKLLLDSKAVMLWGNHDLNYILTPPWTCSGYQWHTEEPLQEIIQANQGRFLAAYAVDGWLLTHAGCHIRVAKHSTNAVELADMLNKKMAAFLDRPTKFLLPNKTLPCPSMFNVSVVRGGDHRSGGIFWFDFKREDGLANVKQIFGHTETPEPVVTATYVALDTTNNKTYCWLYDTATNELVSLDLPKLKPKIQNNEPGLIAELPKDEQGPFTEYLMGKSAPFRGGYWQADYRRWIDDRENS